MMTGRPFIERVRDAVVEFALKRFTHVLRHFIVVVEEKDADDGLLVFQFQVMVILSY